MGGAPVVLVRKNQSLLDSLKEYYTDRRSVANFFEVRIQPGYIQRCGMPRQAAAYLSDFSPSEQVHLILNSLYFKASDNFKMKLRMALQRRNGLTTVRQWFHTADAAVLPYLISRGVDYERIDRLCRWALENCANNYAQFQKDWKILKKSMRKGFAVNKGYRVSRSMRTYYTIFSEKEDFASPAEWGRYVLLWTQTRATGLADGGMIIRSIDKFVETVTTPSSLIQLNPQVLEETCRGALGADAHHARISVGTTACLESTRREGGKAFHLRRLTAKGLPLHKRPLHTVYEPIDLKKTVLQERRRCRNSRDIVYWATQYALHHPTAVRCIRVHAVAEPGKARTITVAPYAYQVLMGVFAHVFQATLRSRGVISGLTRDRHLWRFLTDTMNPQSTMWEHFTDGQPIWGLSSDLSEATDYGDPYVARQVWVSLIQLARCKPKFPVGLAVLAMNLYCGKRYVFVPVRGGYKLVTTTRGWFMGDMMTKVILTIVHDYTMRLVGIKVYSLVGDDEIALHNSRERLVAHLNALRSTGLKVSVEDTYISTRLIFYCEEGALVPQRPTHAIHVSMRRQVELGYLDYPRIRLLLAESCETDNYSMTNLGRFTLLGKETRWCANTNKAALKEFETAGLLQHVLVPQDSDTLSPYTPIEMGGDGSFTTDSSFLRRVVNDKSKDPRETLYRMCSLMENTFNFRFVRSERTTEVMHKHHMLMPVHEELAKYLGEAVIRPKDEQMRILLSSLKVRGLERAEHTWVRMCRGFYYELLFQGRKPLEPKFNREVDFKVGRTQDPDLNMAAFIRHWANPGFRFSNPNDYYVRRDLAERLDPLNLNWQWEAVDFLKYPSAFEVFSNYIRDEVDFTESAFEDVINLLKHSQKLPERVAKRLNLFMESDSYILSTLPESVPGNAVGVVTRDFRLCAEIRKRLKRGSSEVIVYALDPSAYLTGRFYEGVQWNRCKPYEGDFIEDAGAILHCDYTEFTDGKPHDWLITGYESTNGSWVDGYPLVANFHSYHVGVVVITYHRTPRHRRGASIPSGYAETRLHET